MSGCVGEWVSFGEMFEGLSACRTNRDLSNSQTLLVEKPVVSSHRRWREIDLRLQTLKLYNFLIFELPKKNKKMLNNLRHKMERQWFGVLTRMGAKLGIPVSKLRVFFIYSTFATAGVFFLIYLGLAFTLWIKDMFITRRPSVFDL